MLLKSPPMSGKSSLASMFSSWCRARSFPVVSLSLIPVDTSTLAAAEDGFQCEWQRAAGGHPGETIDIFGQLSKRQRPCVYIVDDAQRAYHLADFVLWRLVKVIQQGSLPNVRLICLSSDTSVFLANGASSVTFTPDATMQLDDLRLCAAERDELYQRFSELPFARRCVGVLPQRTFPHRMHLLYSRSCYSWNRRATIHLECKRRARRSHAVLSDLPA